MSENETLNKHWSSVDVPDQKEKPLITHTNGKLTRVGAMIETRKKYGDLGTISSDEELPRMVWCIGEEATLGKGNTWEEALTNCKPSKKKMMV